MKEYRLTRLSDRKQYRLICRSDKRAEQIIGDFIRESDIKSMWRVDKLITRRRIEMLTVTALPTAPL